MKIINYRQIMFSIVDLTITDILDFDHNVNRSDSHVFSTEHQKLTQISGFTSKFKIVNWKLV